MWAARRGLPRKRHRGRWILASVAALVVLAVAAVGIFVKLQPTLPVLALPTARAAAPSGPLGGTWDASSGSVAGFRVRESALGFSNDVVGRTSAVSGAIVVAGDQVTRGRFRVDLTTITVNGKTQPQFATSLATRDDPVATFTLSDPVALSSAFFSGAVITVRVTGHSPAGTSGDPPDSVSSAHSPTTASPSSCSSCTVSDHSPRDLRPGCRGHLPVSREANRARDGARQL